MGRATPTARRCPRFRSISIHALRGEGDPVRIRRGKAELISIHALRGEGDRFAIAPGVPKTNFYPRPPWGGRPWFSTSILSLRLISIHALRGEGDAHGGSLAVAFLISIHALRGEGDQKRFLALCIVLLFLSTPSVGRATDIMEPCQWYHKFLSTPSVGRATYRVVQEHTTQAISIHALRGEGDTVAGSCRKGVIGFLSTPSVGRATLPAASGTGPTKISIHALRGEGDGGNGQPVLYAVDFYPRPPWGGRLSLLVGLLVAL